MENNSIKQCCRYVYSVYNKVNIKQILIQNPWLFNNSWNIYAYYDKQTKIPDGVFEIEKNWKTDNFVLFSGMVNNLKDYLNKLEWDDFGTWYIYLYPTELPDCAPQFIGRDSILDLKQRYNASDFMQMTEEWKFIHEVKPDIFISKRKKGVIVGSLSELNLMDIDEKLNT